MVWEALPSTALQEPPGSGHVELVSKRQTVVMAGDRGVALGPADLMFSQMERWEVTKAHPDTSPCNSVLCTQRSGIRQPREQAQGSPRAGTCAPWAPWVVCLA